jgi:hypothetical protein
MVFQVSYTVFKKLIGLSWSKVYWRELSDGSIEAWVSNTLGGINYVALPSSDTANLSHFNSHKVSANEVDGVDAGGGIDDGIALAQAHTLL